MKRTIFLCFMSIILCSCNNDPLAKYEKMADNATAEHAKKQFQDHRMRVWSTGGGSASAGNRYTHLSITFRTREALDIDTSRKLIVDGVEDYLRRINSREELRPQLVKYPFDSTNIMYKIYVVDNEGTSIEFSEGVTEDNKITYVSMDLGKIAYLIRVPGNKPLIALHEETFDEAAEIVHNSN